MKNLAVAGTGYVGLVTGVCMAENGHNVTCVDIDEQKVQTMRKGISPIYEAGLEELMHKNIEAGRLHFTTDYQAAYKEADAVFIGVGTPEKEDGSANLQYVETVAKQIAESVAKNCLVVVKSTVPIGTNDKIEELIKNSLVNDVRVEVASNPEFLAQGSAVKDTLEAARIVIGTESEWAENLLTEIYTPFNLPNVSVNRRSAEMIKYASNDFLALKISYMNDIANLCELVGADIQDVAEGMSYDDRIGNKFLNAGIGYGGSCFPKDTSALEYLARQYGYDLRTMQATIKINSEQKLKLYEKAKQRLETFDGIKVAVLGLTFKPGTDDLREAPSLANVPLLLEQGADIYAYDPIGINNFKQFYSEGSHGRGNITYVNHPEAALEEAAVCLIFTEWGEIKAVTPNQYKDLMQSPLVFDGRNIYDLQEMADSGVEYHSIGRPSVRNE
ncbi:UDP-glucose dehydrogenase family protein [Oceanobacillus jeddahense]|uniref:UDP-glucose dehydrogenase family protein n=1 Tax=Oceanobacillus jeddahense TaxID=1462527 RepID=UPI0005961ED3|nr:UDP-glucose/GDP-mannose dehydrogenase family protein [Oceanobacillus jeddahense]